jgi:hypothetical protein
MLESLKSVVKVLLGVRRHNLGPCSLLFATVGLTNGKDFALVYYVNKAIKYLLKRKLGLLAVYSNRGIVYSYMLHSYTKFLI